MNTKDKKPVYTNARKKINKVKAVDKTAKTEVKNTAVNKNKHNSNQTPNCITRTDSKTENMTTSQTKANIKKREKRHSNQKNISSCMGSTKKIDFNEKVNFGKTAISFRPTKKFGKEENKDDEKEEIKNEKKIEKNDEKKEENKSIKDENKSVIKEMKKEKTKKGEIKKEENKNIKDENKEIIKEKNILNFLEKVLSHN